jgi:hypothetical protein
MTVERQPIIPRVAFPSLFLAADDRAAGAQASYLKLLRVRLLLLSVAAAAAIPAVSTGHVKPFAILSAAAFAAAGAIEAHLLRSHPEVDWYRARAVAESVKTLAWRYMVGGDPVAISLEGADAEFVDRLREILNDLSDLTLPIPTGSGQLTAEMREARGYSLDRRRELYRQSRILDQMNWYSNKSRDAATKARFWASGLLILELIAALGGALRAAGVFQTNIGGLAATIAAGIVAWSQARDYGSLSSAYSVAANELSIIEIGLNEHMNEEQWGAFVAQCEEAISREHTLWRASHSKH